MADIKLTQTETWAPDPRAMPRTQKTRGGKLLGAANGTRLCCGGWQFRFDGIRGGQGYRIRTRVRHKDLAVPRDSLLAVVCWDDWDAASHAVRACWNYLLPRAAGRDTIEFECRVKAPKGARCLTVRLAFRWSLTGESRWDVPTVEPCEVPERKPVKVCTVNATRQTRERFRIRPFSRGLDLPPGAAEPLDVYATLVQAACRKKAQLIVLPEVVLRGEHPIDGALEVPGPATAPFEQIARDHDAHVVLGMVERNGEAVHNSAVLVGPGGIAGVYRKVHLATISEDISGTEPGDGFPVFDTPIGRIGCLICMDTTVCESARMLALNGAEFICFPIMGDLRADRFSPGSPVYNESRWKAIMRTRAIDNQLCMVLARNDVQGSCIIDRKGDILAWNEGYDEFTMAEVRMEDGYREWNGGDFREATFLLRRPHLYGLYSDEFCLAGLPDRQRRGTTK